MKTTQVMCVFERDVASSKYNMARLHKRRGEMETAQQLFLECETISAKVHGPDHSDTLDAARQASLSCVSESKQVLQCCSERLIPHLHTKDGVNKQVFQ